MSQPSNLPAAERAYLFRHAVVRDAVYGLQLPTNRAELHLLAADTIETLFGDQDAAAIADHLTALRDLSGREDQLGRERRSLLSAAERATELYDSVEALNRYDRLAGITDGEARVHALRQAAQAAQSAGLYTRSESIYERLKDFAQQACRDDWHRHAMHGLANLYVDLGRMREAEEFYRAAPVSKGHTMTWARLLTSLGRGEQAEVEYRGTLEEARAAGDKPLESRALGGLSVLLFNTGRADEAERLLREALQITREIGDLRYEGFWTGSLAVRLAVARRQQESLDLYRTALEIARKTGDRRSEGLWLSYLATNAMEFGSHDDAEALFIEAMQISREIGDIARQSLNLGNHACLNLTRGRLDQVENLLEQALELDRRAGNPQFEAAHLCDRARLRLMEGDRAAARADWEKGSLMLRELGDTQTLNTARAEMRRQCESLGVEPLE